MFFYLQVRTDQEGKERESPSDARGEDVIFVSYMCPTRIRVMSSLLQLTS